MPTQRVRPMQYLMNKGMIFQEKYYQKSSMLSIYLRVEKGQIDEKSELVYNKNISSERFYRHWVNIS